ncbi:MAG: hypothetical protein H6736_01040 [Alphaproteobacteria bacterium]|nr:hypothetical protein [Alphaproteobacteria bacterium]
MLLLATTALALDCANPPFDTDACPLVNAAAEQVNSVAGTTVISDGASDLRLDTATIHARFVEILDALELAGCVDAGFYVDGGVYAGSGVTGQWSTPTGTASGNMFGFIDIPGRTFRLSYDEEGDPSSGGEYGNHYAAFNTAGRLLTQYDDPEQFVAGIWMRTRGRNGVFLSIEGGFCPNSAEDDMQPWFVGDSGGVVL